MSLLGKDPCVNTTTPTYLAFSSTAVTILSSVVSFVGNTLVVLAVWLDPNKDLRSPFSYFVVNLAVADLVVGLVTCPLSAMYLISEGLKRPNQQFRLGMHMSYFISCTASLLSLTALTIERYLAITYPMEYRAKLNPFRALFVSVIVWIASVLLSLNYFLVGYNKFRFIFANSAIAVTFAVLIFTSIKILKYLRLQVEQWEHSAAKRQAATREKHITKVLIVVLILFLACYFPSCVCIYIVNLCSTCDCKFIHWVRDIQFVLVMANSGVNPFVYAWGLGNFRKAFRSILTHRTNQNQVRSVSFNRFRLHLSSLEQSIDTTTAV